MFHTLPNTCIVFHHLHYGHGKFSDRVKILHKHKLYQVDYIYLYPSPRDQINFYFQQKLLQWK